MAVTDWVPHLCQVNLKGPGQLAEFGARTGATSIDGAASPSIDLPLGGKVNTGTKAPGYTARSGSASNAPALKGMTMSTTSKGQGNRAALAVGGFFLLHLLCCGLPLLIAAGALGAVGSVLGNPWVIAAALVLAAVTMARALLRRREVVPGETEDCCGPGSVSDQDPARDRILQRPGGR